MYNDIADIYLEIFPLNRAFLEFLPAYLGNPSSAVLDLGCGPGDYVDELTRAGYQVVGIDNSEIMIQQAQTQKSGTFYHLSFEHISQLQGTPENRFDCVYCVGNSLSYLPEAATLPFLEEVFKLLKPSGRFVLQVVNWDRHDHLRSSGFPVNPISEGRTFHRRYVWVDRSQVIFHTEVRKDGETLKSWADHLYPKYLNATLDNLRAAGLGIIGQFGDYRKSPFDPQTSPAMILTGQK
jgi:SAM-dependent methyltransferase